MDSSDLTDIATEVLRRAPDWARTDLASRDPATRARAEETLAGMIAAAVDLSDEAG